MNKTQARMELMRKARAVIKERLQAEGHKLSHIRSESITTWALALVKLWEIEQTPECYSIPDYDCSG